MCPPAKVNGVWPFNDAWLRTSLSWARRQAPRNGASILDSARELGIRDAQVQRENGQRFVQSFPDAAGGAGIFVLQAVGKIRSQREEGGER